MKSNFKTECVYSPMHIKYVASQPCLITGYQGEYGVAHHLLRVEPVKGMGYKNHDMWCVPLHSTIHDALHKNGDEELFFINHGLSYYTVKCFAMQFAKESPDRKIRMAMKIWEQEDYADI